MARIENIIGKFPRLTHMVDILLPERVKDGLRKTLLHETYPMPEPFLREINGIKARFWINNVSDFYRIVRDGFEDGFVTELVKTIQPENCFLDIGSAQGLYTILAAKMGSNVIAVDPDPISYRSIKKT